MKHYHSYNHYNYIPEEKGTGKSVFTKKGFGITVAYKIIYNIKNKDMSTYVDYYQYLLKTLKNDLRILTLYEDCMQLDDDKLVLVVSTEAERTKLNKVLPEVNKFYKKIGYIYMCI